MFPSHTLVQQASIADPRGGGGPYGHHPVAIAIPESIIEPALPVDLPGTYVLLPLLPSVREPT